MTQDNIFLGAVLLMASVGMIRWSYAIFKTRRAVMEKAVGVQTNQTRTIEGEPAAKLSVIENYKDQGLTAKQICRQVSEDSKEGHRTTAIESKHILSNQMGYVPPKFVLTDSPNPKDCSITDSPNPKDCSITDSPNPEDCSITVKTVGLRHRSKEIPIEEGAGVQEILTGGMKNLKGTIANLKDGEFLATKVYPVVKKVVTRLIEDE